jgi:hypothetical protein
MNDDHTSDVEDDIESGMAKISKKIEDRLKELFTNKHDKVNL